MQLSRHGATICTRKLDALKFFAVSWCRRKTPPLFEHCDSVHDNVTCAKRWENAVWDMETALRGREVVLVEPGSAPPAASTDRLQPPASQGAPLGTVWRRAARLCTDLPPLDPMRASFGWNLRGAGVLRSARCSQILINYRETVLHRRCLPRSSPKAVWEGL